MGVEGLDKMSLDLSDFFKNVAPGTHIGAVKKIAFDAYKRFVQMTPVDTGRARANWGITINKPRAADESVDRQEYGSDPGDTFMAQAQAANASAEPRQTIYCTNSLPYILALEEGHSKQGAHMVELTVMEIKSHYGV